MTKVLPPSDIIATLPEDDLKEENKIKLKSAAARQLALQKRDKNQPNAALPSLEPDLQRVQKEKNEIDTFMADINTQKASL